MIDLYTWTTPNGRKVSIMLEEVGIPYRAQAVDIGNDEQFAEMTGQVRPIARAIGRDILAPVEAPVEVVVTG